MVGEIEPLKQMQLFNGEEKEVFQRIIEEYPTVFLSEEEILYRVRKNPEENPTITDFDSPPLQYLGNGRLDNKENPIFYCSTDLELCLHECRVSSEDQIYVGIFKPSKLLKMLDLSVILDEDCTEFESLDLSVLMLFLASQHAYKILQKLSSFVRENGFDGIIYPSYFSMLKTGNIPFETVIGISNRRIKDFKTYEAHKIVQSIALFGYPLRDNKLEVISTNKLHINTVKYDFTMAPIY
ncbi:RES domain-containing protein [Acinetobacter chengduensis]|uniref:RES domain-containing protein n=2 Tax=Moraxellaceae TaxID=468 RepID=A0ABX9TZN1_9GAMM|nr:RES family NAD+ phosphorylase [Acinetobacter sp. FL51]RKG43747.1 RES domain-containing protein [Acinetobacter sp. WCHAc060007]RLL24127.1 RES domain-containing protein [Acinetobacter chengduensis]